MSQFTDENSELIWGYSKDNSLEDGQVKVTVLATGFGMKNIPGVEPIVNDMKQEEQALTLQEQMKKQAEEQQLNQMVGTFYKPDYKMYIFKGDEMYNEEFLAALDNSPTYSRTAKDLERIISILGNETVVTASVDVTTIDEVENSNIIEENGCDDEDDDNVGCPVFYNE